MAVYEELADPAPGKAKLKKRALSQVVTPSCPTYVHDFILRADDIPFRESKPLVGVLGSAAGYSLVEVRLEERELAVTERLTEEGVRAALACGGFQEPLYAQHVPGSVLNTMAGAAVAVETLSGYSDADFPHQVLRRVCRAMELGDALEHFRLNSRPRDPLRPRPIYESTATQIGLSPNACVPPLVDQLLPPGSPAQARRFLLRWLRSPPSRTLAAHMAALCGLLGTISAALPRLYPVPVNKLVSQLEAGQGNAALFRDVAAGVEGVLHMLRSPDPEVRALCAHLLPLVESETGLPTTETQLSSACAEVLTSIRAVVPPEGVADLVTRDDGAGDCAVPREFFERQEGLFRGMVSRDEPGVRAE